MRRDEWFERLCSSTLQSLPDGAARLLRALPDLDTSSDASRTPDLGPSVVAGEIARRYAAGEHPDDIAAWFDRAGWHPGPEAVTELIVPVCERYRTGGLPFPRWWRPDQLVGTLLRWYARARLELTDPQGLGAELIQRWELAEDDAIDVMVNASSAIVDAPGIFMDPGHDAPSRWLRKVAASKEIRAPVEAALEHYPPALRERDDLLAMARYSETHAAIGARLRSAGGWRDPVVEVAVERLNSALDASAAVLLSLSPYERRLLEPEGELESRFARAMEIRRRAFTIDLRSGGANALPDRVDGVWRSTQWLEDYVYLQGGRIMRRSAGPIAHWSLVLDDADVTAAVADLLADPEYMPRGGLAETSGLAAFHLRIDDDPADPLLVEFAYDDTPHGLLDLVVLLQARRVRLDVFALHDSELAGVATRMLPVPDEAIARLLDRMLPTLDAVLADAQTMDGARIGIGTRADDWAIVAAIDAAKSADLLSALDPGLIVGVARVDAKRRGAFQAARSDLLDALAARAARAHGGKPVNADALVEARQRYARTVDQLRVAPSSQPKRRDDRARVNRLVEGLVDDERAVLTLTLARSPVDGSSRVCGYWLSGAAGRRAVGTTVDSVVSLEQLQSAAPLPLQEPWDLDALIAAAPTLGRDLVAPLRERKVRELIIVPVSFLHALPLHLWPATDDPEGERLCDVFDCISYAPSLALLQHLAGLAPRTAGKVVAAAHGADLSLAKPEASVLSQLTAGRTRVLPAATKRTLAAEATDAGVLHLACHGTWFIGDYWRSGLALEGADDAEQWLSVAEIQKTLDLRGAALVCLSACESGVSASDLWRVDDYLGIDGAFHACGARAVVSSLWSVTDAVSLLFTATMYHSLATGSTIAQAYRAATSMFALSEYRSIDGRHPVGALLQQAGVNWPLVVRELDEMSADLAHPFYWGVFKLSGLVRERVMALRTGGP